jgi:hypothetical protein
LVFSCLFFSFTPFPFVICSSFRFCVWLFKACSPSPSPPPTLQYEEKVVSIIYLSFYVQCHFERSVRPRSRVKLFDWISSMPNYAVVETALSISAHSKESNLAGGFRRGVSPTLKLAIWLSPTPTSPKSITDTMCRENYIGRYRQTSAGASLFR